MNDDPSDIELLERRMDLLRDEIESCRKAMLLSRAAVAIGAATFMATLLGVVRSTPILLFAIAAAIAGLVGLGSNRTSREIARAELAQRRAERDALIDELSLRPFQ